MVRTYVHKTAKATYSEEDFARAVEKIRNGEWTHAKATEITNVPRGTFASRLARNSVAKRGRSTALTREEEAYLVKLITTLQEYGELSTCQDVLKYAAEYVDLMNLSSRFSNGTPTKEWYYGLVKRWENELKLMKSIQLEKSRVKCVTRECVDGWFAKLHALLTKLDLFDKPQQIFNTDESGFTDHPGKQRVLVKRDTKYANLNESLAAIDKIVEKHFGQSKETARAKKHLLSRPHGVIVTDVDEYVLSVIRKKKAAKVNKTGTTTKKTASKLRKQKPSTNTLDILVSDHFNDVDANRNPVATIS
ncbi:unnamed protein product [Didymodactylos carnosus]|uniref:HTH psq-type domain-containing protein n=1 Tax=Didymodactylos carnosus TaxID=1234261 RepID=A0A815C9G1_9BILA|nr:unnamed protein product [Didymodactylos carnosus]CAF1280434.1 unnamed protein product [Didymodactylos carnosus]CAF3789479.1 unnamed protein product [Didymodactylos carnosus]CAF4075353.1 unnamed protein product [Didymodactylos carnosus]